MMYPFMTINENTGAAHSDAYDVNRVETVKVYFEQPVEGGFRSAECYLPSYKWSNSSSLPGKGDWTVPQIFKIGSFAAKIWITRSGRCLLCNNVAFHVA